MTLQNDHVDINLVARVAAQVYSLRFVDIRILPHSLCHIFELIAPAGSRFCFGPPVVRCPSVLCLWLCVCSYVLSWCVVVMFVIVFVVVCL